MLEHSWLLKIVLRHHLRVKKRIWSIVFKFLIVDNTFARRCFIGKPLYHCFIFNRRTLQDISVCQSLQNPPIALAHWMKTTDWIHCVLYLGIWSKQMVYPLITRHHLNLTLSIWSIRRNYTCCQVCWSRLAGYERRHLIGALSASFMSWSPWLLHHCQ